MFAFLRNGDVFTGSLLSAFQEERAFQKDLQHHRGEQRDRERVDGNVLGKVFDEKVQHHEIDEGRSQEAKDTSFA